MSGRQGCAIRVGSLQLLADSRDRVAPFVGDLEDALRTASLAAGGGAIVKIRRLNLGRIRPGLSRQALARLLEQRLAETPRVIARADRQLPGAAEAVVFPDLVTAGAIAVDAALRGELPHWAIRQCFPGAVTGTTGVRVYHVLEALRSARGISALGRLGEVAPAGLRRLGAALASLAPHQLERLLDPIDLSLDPGPIASTVVAHGASAGRATCRATGAIEQTTLLRSFDQALAAAPSLLRDAMATWLPIWGARSPRLTLMAAAIIAARGGEPAVVTGLIRLRAWLASLPPQAYGHGYRDADSAPRATTGRHQTGVVSDATPASRIAPGAVGERPSAAVPTVVHTGASGHDAAAPLSAHAGLWLLIAALRWAGVEAAERALGMPLGLAVMQAFAERAGIAADDPARGVLDDSWSFALDAPVLPATAWRPGIEVMRRLAGQRRLRARRVAPGIATLELARHDQVLGMLDVRTLRQVRSAFRLAPGPARPAPANAELIRSLALSTQRLVRLLSGMRWRTLVERAGRVDISATHMDVTFDARQLDLRIRKGGFDIDPGWVPWLGRVVSFHYDYTEVREHQRAERQGEGAGDGD